ncbi:HTH-type transcriptional regulator malT [Actinoplanes sp. SE50]|uniref:LuxR family transcriptional regulator n=1 Tax=unclassified Actinoplanes TaxID=2626549 RepID=UPI00023EC4CC|nr:MULTISPECIES: LuxR family transcriptional regulator [unclassified Actinoplanes]AEV85876.1 HTH-type transcriptional regulator malT [Actinoplanes sp. SE50/110]ATO84272.1 HTH-type transcriptional regulator malT [Actinoplanes sp. SE50]SLM01682.1 ATP-dependent transcriptional regulator, MalT-like, LuxR family [Actinoplanes sp. SE50/110]
MYTWNDDGRWPLVGREDELHAFAGLLSGARRQGFVISGPMGVGKSRLAVECLTRAGAAGFRTARVNCSEAAGTVPLGAVVHLLPPDLDLADPVAAFRRAAEVFAVGRDEPGWLLLIDDLHLLDRASAVLLRQLVDAGSIRFVATVRAGAPQTAAADALCRTDAVLRVDLGPLRRDDVADLLRRVLGGPVAQQTVREFGTASAGNALYLHELVVDALRRAAFRWDGLVWEADAPAGTTRLREMVRPLLAAAGRDLIELVALCEPVPLAEAERVATPGELAGMEAAGLLRADRDGPHTTVSFAHPMYGEVARADVPLLRRRTVLLEQAERVEGYGLRTVSFRLAATGTADPELLRRAATVARHAHDYPHTITLLRAIPQGVRTVADVLLLADALLHLGRGATAERELAAAAGHHALAESDRVQLTIARTRNLYWQDTSPARALAINRRARAAVKSATLHHVLDLNEGCLRFVQGEMTEAVRLLDRLEPEVDDAADVTVWFLAAGLKPDALAAAGRTAEAIEWARRAYRANRRHAVRGLLPHAASHLTSLGAAQAEAGDLAVARETLTAAFAELLDAGAARPQVWAAMNLGRTELIAGRLTAARHWYSEAATLTRALGYRRAHAIATAGLAAAAAQQGEPRPDGMPADGTVDTDHEVGRAWTLAAAGHLTEARELLGGAVGVARAGGRVTEELYLLTEISRLGGAKPVAHRVAELARECDGRLAAARAAFVAALAGDDPDRLLGAAATLRGIGADLLAAEAANAASLAFAAAGQARRAAAAATLAVRPDGAATPLLAVREPVVPLTGREREVALRAAAGASSRDIARSLTLSVRTVDNHLNRAYAKLGVTGRRDLPGALAG